MIKNFIIGMLIGFYICGMGAACFVVSVQQNCNQQIVQIQKQADERVATQVKQWCDAVLVEQNPPKPKAPKKKV